MQRLPNNTTVSTSRIFSNPATPLRSSHSLHLRHSVTDAYTKLKAPDTDAVEVMPLLRAVIHECHRFLLFYPDPSELIMQPLHPPPPEPKSSKRTGNSMNSPSLRQCSQNGKDATRSEEPASSPKEPESPRSDHQLVPVSHPLVQPPSFDSSNSNMEQPTAFHAILGITLFLFGNLMAHDPSLALEGESASPTAYWLAALDVFETGENLPSRTDPDMSDAPEDWRMAVVWGRTLVCLADVKITRSIKAPHGNLAFLSSQASFTAEDEPDWSPNSPFHAIASRRPPVTRRMTLTSASAHDLMVLAMDQFSRGILHMPRRVPPPTGNSPQSLLTIGPCFSRAGELFAIASEVLGVAERLDSPEDRHHFSLGADSIFNQVSKSSSGSDPEWSTRVALSRGRCWLNMASSKIEEYEAAIEQGDDNILSSPQVEETREELSTGLFNSYPWTNSLQTDEPLSVPAIEFFECAKNADPSTISEDELAPLRPLVSGNFISFMVASPAGRPYLWNSNPLIAR